MTTADEATSAPRSVLAWARLALPLLPLAGVGLAGVGGIVMGFVDDSFSWPVRMFGACFCAFFFLLPGFGAVAYILWRWMPWPRMHRTPGRAWALLACHDVADPLSKAGQGRDGTTGQRDRTRTDPAAAREEAADERYAGPGVLVPLAARRRHPITIYFAVGGLGLTAWAIRLAITGEGVEDPHGVERWIGAGVLGGLGLLFAGVAAIAWVIPPLARIDYLLLTPAGLLTKDRELLVTWDRLGDARVRRVRPTGVVAPVVLMDLVHRGATTAFHTIDVTTVANPGTLCDLLRAPARQPALRAVLDRPGAVDTLRPFRPTR